MKKTNNSYAPAIVLAVVGVFVIAGIYVANKTNGTASGGQAGAGGGGAPSSIDDLVGKPAPKFSLSDRNGTEYSLENLKGKNVVLFFNEGIMCYPGCWNQVASLGKDARFNGGDTLAFSVVVDQPNDWAKAIQKMPELESAKILFDTSRSASRAYAMLTANSSMHFGSLPGHTYVLIDKEGVVRYVYDDPRMAINNELITAEVEKLE